MIDQRALQPYSTPVYLIGRKVHRMNLVECPVCDWFALSSRLHVEDRNEAREEWERHWNHDHLGHAYEESDPEEGDQEPSRWMRLLPASHDGSCKWINHPYHKCVQYLVYWLARS